MRSLLLWALAVMCVAPGARGRLLLVAHWWVHAERASSAAAGEGIGASGGCAVKLCG